MSNRLERKLWFVQNSSQPLAKFNLFCFHHAGGAASHFSDWQRHLPATIQVNAIQLPGRDHRYGESFYNSVSQIVDKLLTFEDVFREKPFVLFGHSLGAIIAFELTKTMQKKGLSPMALIVSGRSAPALAHLQEPIHHLPDELFIKQLILRYGGLRSDVLQSAELMSLLLPRIRADVAMAESWKYEKTLKINCPLFVFGGDNDVSVSEDDLSGWQLESENKIRIFRFSGDHFFIETDKIAVMSKIRQVFDRLSTSV